MLENSVSAAPADAAPVEMNIDTLAARIVNDLTDREKLIVSAIVTGSEKSLPNTLGLATPSAKAYVSHVLRKLKVPNFEGSIRRRYVKAAALKAIGYTSECTAVLAEIAAERPRIIWTPPPSAEKQPKRPVQKTERQKTGSKPPDRKWATPARSTGDEFIDAMMATHSALRAFAISLTGNVDRADDLVQETFLRAIANRHSFQPGTNMPAWLFTILRNLFRSEYRKRRREVEDADGEYAATLKTPPEQISHVEFQEFTAALHKLPDDQREALVLIGASGFSYEEAAEICGCACGTIKSRVNRARTRLADLLHIENAGDFGPDRVSRAVFNGDDVA